MACAHAEMSSRQRARRRRGEMAKMAYGDDGGIASAHRHLHAALHRAHGETAARRHIGRRAGGISSS